MISAQIVIIGGGVNGVSIARSLANATSSDNLSIVVLEKERKLGAHSSTRNSGVIHAGFYYDTNSIRGSFCSEANKMLRDYCVKRKLPVNKCGKVIVTKNPKQEVTLQSLHERGLANKVDLQIHSADRLSEYEPLAKTTSNFLWSPNTWSSSPVDYLNALVADCRDKGVKFVTNAQAIKFDSKKIIMDNGDCLYYDYLVNAAGGASLKIAKQFGLGKNYSILPFKGLYLKSKTKNNSFSAHIYPVPDARQTFLGIHTTITYDGYLKLGPTAIPVLGPEHYSIFSGVSLENALEILPTHAALFANNSFGFRDLALREFRYLFKNEIIKTANELVVDPLNSDDFDWYSPGIRAQLLDVNRIELVSDFIFETTDRSIHLLNSISPSWTCSLKTGNVIAQEVIRQLS